MDFSCSVMQLTNLIIANISATLKINNSQKLRLANKTRYTVTHLCVLCFRVNSLFAPPSLGSPANNYT